MKVNRFVVYLAKDGWRWHLKRPNGRIIAESGEAYSRERDALKGVQMVISASTSWALIVKREASE